MLCVSDKNGDPLLVYFESTYHSCLLYKTHLSNYKRDSVFLQSLFSKFSHVAYCLNKNSYVVKKQFFQFFKKFYYSKTKVGFNVIAVQIEDTQEINFSVEFPSGKAPKRDSLFNSLLINKQQMQKIECWYSLYENIWM